MTGATERGGKERRDVRYAQRREGESFVFWTKLFSRREPTATFTRLRVYRAYATRPVPSKGRARVSAANSLRVEIPLLHYQSTAEVVFSSVSVAM
jgi:hypothetical protein